MNIQIYTYTSSPCSYYKEGRKEYEKRLSRYCKIKHTLCKNQKQLDKVKASLLSVSSDKNNELIVSVITGLTESLIDSPGLARFIEENGVQGISSISFLVGFPEDKEFFATVTPASLSLSRMDIAPDLLSLILEEQIYRAYRIIRKEPYHK